MSVTKRGGRRYPTANLHGLTVIERVYLSTNQSSPRAALTSGGGDSLALRRNPAIHARSQCIQRNGSGA